MSKLNAEEVNFSMVELPETLSSTLAIVIFLMIANWFMEVLRWKESVKIFEPISTQDAWVVVLSGLSLNWVLPFTTGDLLSRISQFQDKYKATSAAILNRGIMLSFTLIIGLYGVSKLATQYEVNGWFALAIIFGVPLLKKLLKGPLDRFLQYFKNLNWSTLIRITCLSVLRYIVFTFQFYLLLSVFLPELPGGLLVAGIGWIFLVRSALPLFLGGLGVREASGILFFEPHVLNLQMIVIPVFLIWIINTVVPSFIGLIFIWRLRWNQ